MNAQELMIGDWVLLGGTAVKIESINLYNGNDSMGGHYYALTEPQLAHTNSWVDMLDPIPFTPEILEKNFGKSYFRGGFNCYRIPADDEEKVRYIVEDRSVSAAPDNRMVFCRDCGTYICDVSFVHQLQHALRLCRIEKEVVL